MALGELRLVAWEITRRCNLACPHCRASAIDEPYEGELSTSECFSVIDDIAEVGRPTIIFTGGEPLLREDFFDIAAYARAQGLGVAIGSNGTLLDERIATKMKNIPISRLGVSLDFPEARDQDQFRGMPGAFEATLRGMEVCRRHGIEVQINSTITKLNVHHLDQLLTLALKCGVVAFHPFFLVPTGRGKNMKAWELSPQEYEHTLRWIYHRQVELGEQIFLKPTDAPHYVRVMLEVGQEGVLRGRGIPEKSSIFLGFPRRVPSRIEDSAGCKMNSITRGCLAGIGFCFISHVGRVQGCGYLDVEAGNLREQKFGDIWQNSPLFGELRDYSKIKGKCGLCEYKTVCGGCRARAYEATGDYLEAEPCCIYQPRAARSLNAVD